ncbi:MAG: hypothetical protein ACR2F9_03645 [Longimicrobiaceae bacterium]
MERHDHDHSPVSRDHHAEEPSTGDLVGEGVGGVSGAFTGAALGSLGGPLGTIIGGIAGAAGGWWAGRSISEAAAHYTEDEDRYYRSHYEGLGDRPADHDYETARHGYALGHIAGGNPDYRGRSFDEVEADLRHGWRDEREGDWDRVRPYAQHAYDRTSKVRE